MLHLVTVNPSTFSWRMWMAWLGCWERFGQQWDYQFPCFAKYK